jgi:hypothetical protein
MNWVIPEHSKNRVNRAGKTVAGFKQVAEQERGNALDPQELLEAMDVVSNWRASHAFPLNTFQNGLRRRGRLIDPKILVAQRIKRLASIEQKLIRFPTMTLSQMQDIGGCRAILGSVNNVHRLCRDYKESSIKHKLHHEDDYITAPKHSGYRGIHLIYRYNSDKTPVYNSLLIEMQIRSQLQHAWATAVEVLGAFIDQSLKSNLGEAEYLRFFSLMGSALAERERTTPVPNTPSKYAELIKELKEHNRKLEITKKLAAFGKAVQIVENKRSSDDHFYLVVADHERRKVSVTSFPQSSSQLASERYVLTEQEARNNPALDVVLVSVDSMSALQRAYPNYFLDTRLFNQIVSETLKSATVPRTRSYGGQLPLL